MVAIQPVDDNSGQRTPYPDRQRLGLARSQQGKEDASWEDAEDEETTLLEMMPKMQKHMLAVEARCTQCQEKKKRLQKSEEDKTEISDRSRPDINARSVDIAGISGNPTLPPGKIGRNPMQGDDALSGSPKDLEDSPQEASTSTTEERYSYSPNGGEEEKKTTQVVEEDGKGTPRPDAHVSLGGTSDPAGEFTGEAVQAEKDAKTLVQLLLQLMEVDKIKEEIISKLSVLKEKVDKADLDGSSDLKADLDGSSGPKADLDGSSGPKADITTEISKSSDPKADLEDGSSDPKADLIMEGGSSGCKADIGESSEVNPGLPVYGKAEVENTDGRSDQDHRKHVERDSSTIDQLQISLEKMDRLDACLGNKIQAGKKAGIDQSMGKTVRSSLQTGGKEFLDPGSRVGVNSAVYTPWTPNAEARKISEGRWREAAVSLALTPVAQEQVKNRLKTKTVDEGRMESLVDKKESLSTPLPVKGGKLTKKGCHAVSRRVNQYASRIAYGQSCDGINLPTRAF